MSQLNSHPTSQAQQPPPYLPDMQPIDVVCGRLKPPGARSANISGPGQIAFCGTLLRLQVKAKHRARFIAPRLLMAAAVFINLPIVLIAGRTYSIVLLCQGLVVLACLCYMMLHNLNRKNMVLQIDPSTHAYFYIPEKRTACLKLPDGLWIAVRARGKSTHQELRAALDAIYGGRCDDRQSRPHMLLGPGGEAKWPWSVDAKPDKIMSMGR